MEDADKFAADILGVSPDNLTDESSDELLTNNEEESSEDIDNTQENSQTSNEEQSEAQQEDTDENETETEEPENQEPRRPNRVQKRIQQLLARQNELAQMQTDEYGDTLTREELQDLVRREAQAIVEQQEIARLQEEQKELWVEDLEYLIQNNPELNPDAPEYNKQLDDFLTNLIVDENGEPNTNMPIAEIYSQLNAIIGERKQIQAQKNKKVLAGQLDEAPLGDGSQAQYQRSKKTISDLDPNDPVAFIKAIENGEVDY
jgi:uncharacterized protein (DUF1778 family)